MRREVKSVAFVTDARAVWGAERSLLGLVRRAAENGYSATIICPQDSPLIEYARSTGDDVTFRFAQLEAHPAFTAGGLQDAGLQVLRREIRATWKAASFVRTIGREFDAVVSFEMWRNLEVALGCLLSPGNAVLDMHDVFSGRLGRVLNRFSGAMASRSIAPSHYTLERTGLTGRKGAVVPRGTNLPSEHVDNRLPGRLRLAVLGEVRSYKRADLFCQVIMECARRGLPVQGEIVGDIKNDHAGRRVRALIDQSNGILHHTPRTQDVFEVLSRCDYVVNSSDEEAFGRTLIEGLACGAVPISFSRTGPAEIIARSALGVVLDDTSTVSGLADQLTDVIADEQLRAHAREHGPDIAAAHFSWESVSSLYYREIDRSVR